MDMPCRALGKTGLRVSRLCFGSLTLSPLQKNLPVAAAAAVLRAAFDAGVNFVDTAQYYRNYAQLRAGLDAFGGDVVLCSKTYAHTAELARAAVEEARRALGRDRIDIFLLHEQEGDDTLRGHRPALEELYRLKAQGVLRAVGISTHRVDGVKSAVRWGLDVVHPLYNLTGLGIEDGTPEEMGAAIGAAHDAGVGVFTMKALGAGHLFARAEEALSWVLRHPAVDSVAVGMQTAAEVRANAAFFATGRFTHEADAALMSQVRRLHIEEDCAGCGACVKRCQNGALTLRNGRAVADSARCLLCGYCAAVCETFSIKVV